MSASDDSIDAAIAAVTDRNYGRAEAVLSALNANPDKRSLRSLHLYAQVVEAQGRSAPVDSLMALARQVPANKVEEAFFFGEMASMLFQRQPGQSRRLEKVAEYLDHALRLGSHPNDEMLLNNLCRVHYELGDYGKLVACAERLLAYPGSRARAGLTAAHASLRLQDSDRGGAFLDGVLQDIDKLDDSQLPWLIDLLILFRRAPDARKVIDRLVDRQYDETRLAWFRAQVRFAEHRFEEALALLSEDSCRAGGHDPATRSKAFYLRGRCLDETGRYAEALDAFEAMNREVRDRYRITDPPAARFSYEGFDYRSVSRRTPEDDLPYSPTFLIGFPRSGTTLLEAMLDSRDDVLTFSETRNLASARSLLRDWNKVYPADLGALDEQQLRTMRSAYFEHNSHLVPQDRNILAVVDKLPLNMLHVPLILTLFPRAKFLLALRHPLDTALSCFQQNFEMTVEMAHFTRLEDALRRYAQVMGLFDTFCNELQFPVLAVRYEDLVADVDRSMTAVTEFLGLEPTDDYREFQLAAARRPVITPSNSQVSREIYSSSVGRWRNYADRLLPLASLVEDWTGRYESRAMPGESIPAQDGKSP